MREQLAAAVAADGHQRGFRRGAEVAPDAGDDAIDQPRVPAQQPRRVGACPERVPQGGATRVQLVAPAPRHVLRNIGRRRRGGGLGTHGECGRRRPGQAAARRRRRRRQGEHLVTVGGHQHRVLPLRGQRMVRGDDRPAVGERADRRAAGVDHRLDGEDHSGLQQEAGPGPPVVHDLRLLVELPADPVAAEFADDREMVALGELLDRVADVAQPRAGLDGADAAPHRLEGCLHQALRLDRRRADVEHPARIAVPPVLDHRDVDVDDVARLELLVARDPVADDVVDRRADRRRIRTMARGRVVERRRHDVLHVDLMVVRDAVELPGRDARLHVRREIVEQLRREAARHAHHRDVLGGLQRDRHDRGGVRRQRVRRPRGAAACRGARRRHDSAIVAVTRGAAR